MKKFLSIVAAAVVFATGASAATVNFVVDQSASTLKVTNTASGLVCSLTHCGVDAAWAVPSTFSVDTGTTATVDLIKWSGYKTGLTVFDVVANLVFSSPAGSVSGSGTGGAVLLTGFIKSGVLTWNNVVSNFAGYDIDVAFNGGAGLFLGKSVTTGASFTVNEPTSPAPVPLPAAAPLLIAGLGAFGGLRALRRRK